MTLPGDVLLLLGGVAVIGLHQRGMRRINRADLRPVASAQAWIFRGAVAVAVLLLLSPLLAWSRDELFARDMLDVGAAFLLAPLVVLGAPWRALSAAVGAPGEPPWMRGQQGHRSHSSRLVRLASRPFVGVAVLLLLVWFWHVPAVRDASVASPGLRALELVSMLAGGVALWMQLVASDPFRPAVEPLQRTWLIVATLLGTSALGMAMLTSHTRWYPAFAAGRHALLSATLDRGYAGAALLAIPVLPLGALAIWCFAAWLRDDEDLSHDLAELIGGPSRLVGHELTTSSPSRPTAIEDGI